MRKIIPVCPASQSSLREAMQAQSWRVVINGSTSYVATVAAQHELQARTLRVYTREGWPVPTIELLNPAREG